MVKDIVRFDWLYTPPDLFEERAELPCDKCVFVVDPGRVRVSIEIDTSTSITDVESLRNELHEKLNARFLATQLVEHRNYTLSQATTLRESASGQTDTFIITETARVIVQQGRTDVICERADGTTFDTQRDRINRRKQLAHVTARHSSDALAFSLLTSYSTAVNNPRNELVHLYEIRDAIAKRFGGEKGARSALGITRAQWSELGRLADAEPILQGRHSGVHFGSLRDATAAELSSARDIARGMIEAYLAYLEKPRAGIS